MPRTRGNARPTSARALFSATWRRVHIDATRGSVPFRDEAKIDARGSMHGLADGSGCGRGAGGPLASSALE